MVKDVEKLGAELKLYPLVDREFTADGKVFLPCAEATQDITAQVTLLAA